MVIKTVAEIIEEVVPYYKKKGGPESSHTLGYESNSQTLEPVYFFILDLMSDFGLAPEKLIDNFTTTPGSGHFSEMGQKASIMQQQAENVMAKVNALLRSVLNIIYDLKEFKIRLEHYNALKSGDSSQKEAALLSLKQIWMDKVDIAKGNSSIKAMGLGQAGFQTLIDAFLVAKTTDDVKKLDLNDRVKRILLPRLQEFNLWATQSEKELRKRYELERTYLKSQVNSLKLYSRWAKPYLKAAQQLEMKGSDKDPALVKVFNTILLELTLLGKSKIDPESASIEGKMPTDFRKFKPKRDYYSCILVSFKFRGIPQRVGQQAHYLFGGKANVEFRGYALNEDELKKIEKEVEDSDVGDILQLIEGTTTESLGHLQEEINSFLEEKSEDEKKEIKDKSNPFLALIGYYDKPNKTEAKTSEKKEDKEKPLRPDDWIEKTHFRKLAGEQAAETSFKLFDVYKKAHGMMSFT
ncbi:MAG: hypothetical protein KKF68_00815 [Nanoarchaeota archaeon]|nr:hypothetical protein [Nanoarchaeota archaeon]